MQIVFEQHAVDYDGRDRSGDESDPCGWRLRPLLLQRGPSATPVEFQQGVAWADQRTFTLDLHVAAQEELAEAPGPLDEPRSGSMISLRGA